MGPLDGLLLGRIGPLTIYLYPFYLFCGMVWNGVGIAVLRYR
jgi:hypothetical protein